jgi:hypothetical protein
MLCSSASQRKEQTMTLQETINEVFAKHDAECLLLTKQRDEARREVCVSLNGNMKQSHEYASDRGWDCFKVQII